MSVTRCVSSHLMSQLLEWRNPQGKEENWHDDADEISCGDRLRKVVTELGIAVLTVSALIETFAYLTLAILSLCRPCRERICPFFVQLFQSSAFTVIWGIFSAIFYNPFKFNVNTHESFAREAIHSCCSCISLRWEDRIFIAQKGTEIEANRKQQQEKMIEIFVRYDILKDVSKQTLVAFKEQESCIYEFLLAKAIFIYAYGKRRTQKIPTFFSGTARSAIEQMRKAAIEQMSEKAKSLSLDVENLETVFNGQNSESATEDAYGYSHTACLGKVVKANIAVFTNIWNTASREQKGSQFLQECTSISMKEFEVLHAIHK